MQSNLKQNIMKKCFITYEICVLVNDDEDAKQKALIMARNERKKYDNQCRVKEIEIIEGLTSRNIEL